MKKTIVILAAVIVCWLIAFVYRAKKVGDSLAPPQGATNLTSFVQLRPQYIEIRKFVLNGRLHLEVIGKPIVSRLSLPSGSPVYIFDETGTLVDWAADSGDAPSFVAKWGSFSNATSINLEDAKKLMKEPVR